MAATVKPTEDGYRAWLKKKGYSGTHPRTSLAYINELSERCHDRGRVISTVSLVLACVGMLVWPLGPLVWVLATIAYARTRTPGNPHNGKTIVAATLGFVQMALIFGLVIVHVIPGR